MTSRSSSLKAGLVLAGLLAAGCPERGAPGRGFRLEQALAPPPAPVVQGTDVPEAMDGELLFEGPASAPAPVAAMVESADERRWSVVTAVAPWRWQGRVPERALFKLGAALTPDSRAGVERLEVRVELASGLEREVLDVGRSADGRWIDLYADLSGYVGREVTLAVRPKVLGPESADRRIAWSAAEILGRPDPDVEWQGPPNLLFILVDTLRADHLTPYGYRRDTSPVIQRELADRGVVVETAYSQAPWTVPSATSYMTSRYPGELLSGPMESYVIPAGVPTLAEHAHELGYQTAAFYGNFVLRDANGFGRGFDTRYTPPAVGESNLLHADTVNERAVPWLEGHQHKPFFLYVHYMDPHDPYDSPEVKNGRSPFYPDYAGTMSGLWVHGLYTGGLAMKDPVADLEHIKALYDSEIHYVDRAIGELLAALDEEVLANTLVVLTADHGEELLDHGGWKHGQTLYQEQIRVPLIFRWDRRLPAGTRLAGTVQLIDLLPTLSAAAGGEPSPAWQGIDLLPALSGTAALPRRTAFAQHLASGPLRAAAVVEGKKLMLFDREEPFVPVNTLIEHLWRLDRERMARRELYDLSRDPGERENQTEIHLELAAALEPAVAQPLDRTFSGLRLMVSGLPVGSRLGGRITFAGSPRSWRSYFLAAEDRVQWDDQSLEFELGGEMPGSGPLEKGWWIPGQPPKVLAIETWWLDESGGQKAGGKAGAPIELLLGNGVPYRGGAIEAATLTVDHRPARPDHPALRLWLRQGLDPSAAASRAVDPEIEKSLRALGYIQ